MRRLSQKCARRPTVGSKSWGVALSPKRSFECFHAPASQGGRHRGEPSGADGFSSLLGGSLRGWSGDPKFWSMNKGVLTGKADGTLKRNHFITWKAATVRNFDLKVKVRIPGGNSGIQYRSTHLPELGLDA